MKKRFLIQGILFLFGLASLFSQTAETTPAKPNNDGTVMVEAIRSSMKGEWSSKPTRLLELLDGYIERTPVPMDIYGGRLDKPAEKATGFFYLKRIDNRWWFVDPEGHLYFNIALSSIRPAFNSPEAKARFAAKYTSEEVWKQQTLDFLREYGFLGLGGNGCNLKLLLATEKKLPYVIHLNFMSSFANVKKMTLPVAGHTGFINECFPVFHPDFEGFCDKYAKDLAATANDPYVLCIYSDNELQAPSDMLDRHLKLDITQPDLKYGYDATVAWLKERGVAETAITDKDREDFRAYVFERYYRIVSAAIKKYAPNHLYAGSRICFRKSQFASEPFWKVMGKYLDLISVNDYGVWGPDPVEDANWAKWSQKPVIITEWYAKAIDIPGLSNQHGAGWGVKTQADRGKYYQHFMLACYESGNIVGSQLFKYQDDPPESKALDSAGGTNKGVIDINYEPHADYLKRIKSVNEQVYSLIDFFDQRREREKIP